RAKRAAQPLANKTNKDMTMNPADRFDHQLRQRLRGATGQGETRGPGTRTRWMGVAPVTYRGLR
ncbi:MAG: hypothetical protein AAFO79_05095, partial [Pseudomonadota bacterium]